jgi:AAA15 family ATPase/GTPase
VHLFSELLVSDAQLALVDEIENGIHYSALPTLFQGIKAVAQDRQVQTLMTTHSWDALRAAAEVFKDTPELFQVIRLERTPDDNVQAVIIDSDELRELIARGYEVR